jgi:ribosome-associated protein
MICAMEDVAVTEGGIRLGQLLKLSGLAESGADAKGLLAAGLVTVNDEVETRRGRQLEAGDVIRCAGRSVRLT